MQIVECNGDELPALMRFIDQHWRKGHILSREKKVLDWYYGTNQGANFLLAKKDGDIIGVLGYIDTDRFYQSTPEHSEIWLALWKVREDVRAPGLGLRLILELKKRYPQRSIAVLGLSEAASKIYSLLRYQVKTLDQLFIYNRYLNSYQLLRGCLPLYSCLPFSGSVKLTDGDEQQLHADAKNIKDSRGRGVEYFINRYVNNPFICYKLFRIECDDEISYVIGRIMNANGANALRLVDVYGSLLLLGQSLAWFEDYLLRQEIEYMDFYVYSELSEQLQKSGFINRNACLSDVVVPNYFEPYVSENIDLQCAMEYGFKGPVFKADGDQERPNKVH
jgi:hypothetical protein|tara:strand:- start:4273 stop:5274 length:1002 start_codon:yes stop_codon:yes gene_type:complete